MRLHLTKRYWFPKVTCFTIPTRVTHVTLAFFVGQASLALATPLKPFVIQELNTPLAGGGFGGSSGSSANAHLDNGTFYSGNTARFLGIRYPGA